MGDASAPLEEDAAGGPIRTGIVRPPGSAAWRKACSFRHPVCVHAARAPGAEILATLTLAERAWDTAEGPLELPPPDPDPETRAYDVYLVDGVPDGAVTAIGERDVLSRVDRASAFTLLDAKLRGCARETAVARELFRAVLFRVAPGTDEGSARAETSYLARLAVTCAAGALDGVEVFQAHPDRALVDTLPDLPRSVGVAYDRGASLFFLWLDETFGMHPGSLVRAIWALTPTMTPLGATHWRSEPDLFEVLRMSFKGTLSTGSTVDDLLLEFAVARALVGEHADDTHALETRTLGAAADVRMDWDVPWPTAPRRLAAPSPTFPTGAAYVRVSRKGAPAGSRLRVETTWEEHATMRWAVVKLDADGREKSRVPIGAKERGTEAQTTVLDLDGVDAVLIVGVNAGDRAVPFDPDDAVWEPHGWVVAIASE